DSGRAGNAVNFHAAEVEYEAVTQRRIDVVTVIRRGQLRRGPERSFANGVAYIVRQRARRPMAKSCQARERQRIVGIGAGADAAFSKHDVAGVDIQLSRRDACETRRKT